MRLPVACLYLLAAATTQAAIAPAADAGRVASALPGGLAKVIAGMAADGCEELTTACLITSRTVTHAQRQAFSQQLLESDDTTISPAAGNADKALAVAQPSTAHEVVASTLAAGGNLIFRPSAVDLARGEGLFESLAPAMEAVVQNTLSASLWVVADDVDLARQQIQKGLESVLATIVTGQPKTPSSSLTSLEDIFTAVHYVTPSQALARLTQESGLQTSATDAASRVAIASKTAKPRTAVTTSYAVADLAAARTLGPLARRLETDAVSTVRAQCVDQEDVPKRVVDFGELAQAAMQSAVAELKAGGATLVSPNAVTAQHIALDLQRRLEFSLAVDFDQQVDLLAEESYQTFRQSLSKLIISPNLASDMQAVIQTSVATFAKLARQLVPPKAGVVSTWSTQAAQASLRTKLQESVTSRLLAARASGKFKPLPRKGVTVGFHWLLPKPFGNDYRQEPWLVHAADNLVYVPADKVTDVDPQSVASGDWRNQIVPSPVGNDMVFLQ
jgi:hypothetical protein